MASQAPSAPFRTGKSRHMEGVGIPWQQDTELLWIPSYGTRSLGFRSSPGRFLCQGLARWPSHQPLVLSLSTHLNLQTWGEIVLADFIWSCGDHAQHTDPACKMLATLYKCLLIRSKKLTFDVAVVLTTAPCCLQKQNGLILHSFPAP